MRSCGRLGPARLGSTVDRSNATVLGKRRYGRVIGAEQALFLGVTLDEL